MVDAATAPPSAVLPDFMREATSLLFYDDNGHALAVIPMPAGTCARLRDGRFVWLRPVSGTVVRSGRPLGALLITDTGGSFYAGDVGTEGAAFVFPTLDWRRGATVAIAGPGEEKGEGRTGKGESGKGKGEI